MRLGTIGLLVLGFAVWGTACTEDQEPSVSRSMVCPFEGTEVLLQVGTDEANPAATPAEVTPGLLEEVITVLSRRVEGLEVSTGAVFTDGADRVRIQLTQGIDADKAERLFESQAELSFRRQRPDTSAAMLRTLLGERLQIEARGSQASTGDSSEADAEALQEVEEAIASLFGPAELTGNQLIDAQPQFNSSSSRWDVAIQFNERGSEIFAEITQQLAGTDRSLGIFLDGTLISAPIVDTVYGETGITDGAAILTGSFREDEVEDIVIQLRSGAMPMPTRILAIETVTRNPNCDRQAVEPDPHYQA